MSKINWVHSTGACIRSSETHGCLIRVIARYEVLMVIGKVNRWRLGAIFALAGLAVGVAIAQPLPKAQVANLIGKVENGVDEFRDYLKKRGENASSAAASPQGQARTSKRAAANPNNKAAAQAGKDELDDALSDLNKSTNRLRRKFDATDTWMETKAEVQRVMDDGRRINQVVARGKYGADAARLWGVLRTGMNDLARAYGVPPLAL